MHAASAGPFGRPHLDTEIAALGDPQLVPGRVLAQHRGRWLVSAPEGTSRLLPCRGRVAGAPPGPPVTGDWVAVDGAGAIAAVLERRGIIARRASGAATERQLLAANVDLALLVAAADDPNPRRLERLAVLAAAGDVPAVLVLTKADVHPDAHLEAVPLGRALGLVDAIAVSALDGTGLGSLRALLSPGTTAVLLGPSGTGKSTLVNALLGEARQVTRAVREEDGRGRHTTVAREIVALPHGALIMDTPGIREIGVWDGDGGSFADIDALAAGCRFRDCGHGGEPGCAVADAVDPARLAAWHKLSREQAWVDDRRAASRERERRGREWTRIQRADRRAKGNDGPAGR